MLPRLFPNRLCCFLISSVLLLLAEKGKKNESYPRNCSHGGWVRRVVKGAGSDGGEGREGGGKRDDVPSPCVFSSIN